MFLLIDLLMVFLATAHGPTHGPAHCPTSDPAHGPAHCPAYNPTYGPAHKCLWSYSQLPMVLAHARTNDCS